MGGVPILLLGVLAAPNAVIAGTAYLSGPGFAVGAHAGVSPFSTAHGTLPAFPVLGAVPSGHGADTATWALIAVVPLLAGLLLARLACRERGWSARVSAAACALGLAALALLVLGWQAGGSIGTGGLGAIGASPWQLALAPIGPVAVVVAVGLAAAAIRGRASRATVGQAVAALARERLSVLTDPGREEAGEPDGDSDGGEAASGDQLAG